MIKVIFLMRRKPGMTFEAFSEYWLNSHAKLIIQHAGEMRIRKYVQSHAIPTEEMKKLRPDWNDADQWDGITEVWVDGTDDIAAIRATAEARALQDRIMADEASFVDLDRSAIIVTQEHVLIDHV